ncbi:Fc.00g001790.m01.CDS01 [Cosmosporella sp. VM-42]
MSSPDLETVIIPPSTPHTHTVIFLHGRGDTAANFAYSLRYSLSSTSRTLITTFPSTRWVFPQPGRDRMNQWFNVYNVQDFSEREDVQAAGLRESVEGVRRVVKREVEVLGGRWDRVVLAGISQGAATSVHTLLNLDIPISKDEKGQSVPRGLGALLCFSARMPFPGRSLAETRAMLNLEGVPDDDQVFRDTPILLEHCADDPLVLVNNGRGLRDTLQGFGADVTWKEYTDGGHWFKAPEGIDDAIGFLERALGIEKDG